MMLGNMGVIVTPSQTAVGSGFQAFDENEQLKDDNQIAILKATIDELVKIATKNK